MIVKNSNNVGYNEHSSSKKWCNPVGNTGILQCALSPVPIVIDGYITLIGYIHAP